MPRLYSVTYNGTLTNAGGNSDLLSVQPADDRPVRLVSMILSNLSEVGDTAEENLRITVNRFPATFTVGSGGSSITAAAPISDAGGTVWGFTARCNDTTVAATSGTIQTLYDLGWNERNTPWDYRFPTDDEMVKAKQTEALVVRSESTPADDLTISLTFVLEEA
jgi:hypothetical protein